MPPSTLPVPARPSGGKLDLLPFRGLGIQVVSKGGSPDGGPRVRILLAPTGEMVWAGDEEMAPYAARIVPSVQAFKRVYRLACYRALGRLQSFSARPSGRGE